MKKIINEIIIALFLVILIIAFLDPFHYWMPGMVAMWILFFTFITFFAFIIFVWREKARDEREEYHLLKAGRLAWITGATMLMIGIVIQELAHELDPWLVYALLVMVLAKLFSLIYGKLRH